MEAGSVGLRAGSGKPWKRERGAVGTERGRDSGIETATALCHSDGMLCLVQVILIRIHSSFNTCGQFLYSLYSIPFRPGPEADLACWITCLTSLILGGDVSNRADGSEGLGTYPGEPRGLFLAGSLY